MKISILILSTLFFISCNAKKGKATYAETEKDSVLQTASEYFQAIQQNDIKLGTPKEGEWLFEHNEPGQSFADYKNGSPLKSGADKTIIFLKPIGNFTETQLKVLQVTRSYVEIFFQLKTILLEPISDKIIPEKSRRLRNGANEQLFAPYILDTLLKNKIPENGFALMAISEKDLYPEESWNYVFGMASYANRVGVSSIYRLQNYDLPDSTRFSICLKRLMNIATHEIGHMFTMAHCTFAKCVMNGGNSLQETDICPNRLCSECQKKLFWNIRYDNLKRLHDLIAFFKQNKLEDGLRLSILDSENLK